MKKVVSITLVLLLVASMVFAAGASETSSTKIWPKNNAVLTVGFSAGGGTDTAVRPVVAEMEKYLGETINVVNQAGGASAVAATNVLAKPHDGYSMFATGSGAFAGFGVNGTSPSTWIDWVSYHPYSGPAAIIVSPKSDIKTLDDFFKYLADGKQNFAIGSFGNGPHVQIEAILKIAGVPTPNYTTLGACRDVGISIIAGDSKVGIGSFSSLIDLANAGQIKVLAVTTANPWTLDNGTVIPSITTLLPGSDTIPQLCETWPIMIPRDVPQNVLVKLEEAFKHALQTEAVKKYASDMAFNIVAYTGEEADKFLAIQTSGYAWTQYDAGLVQISPATLGIPRIEDFDWEVEKKKLNE